MAGQPPYKPILRWQLACAFVMAALCGYWTLRMTRRLHFSALASGWAAGSAFLLGLAQIKYLVAHLLVLVDRDARRALWRQPVVTLAYRNRRIHDGAPPVTPLTVMIPIHDECFDLIRRLSLESAIQEVRDYGPRANLLVMDDGLLVFAGNELEAFEREARRAPASRRTRAQTEVLHRLAFYRRILAEGAIRFGVVARPRPVPGRPETERRGTFKKGSNLNFAHRLADGLEAGGRLGMPPAAALEAGLARLLGPSRDWAYVRGEVAVGEVILLLDKDSTVPPGVCRETVPDFAEDPGLAYVQSATVPSNRSENFFTKMVGYYTGLFYDFAFPMATLLGGAVPLVGHNAFIRTADLRAQGYWREDRASEDLSFALDVAAAGKHGKYLDVQDLRFGEIVSRDFEEEMRKLARHAFGAAEIVTPPIRDWPREGIVTRQLARWLRSPHLPLRVKVDQLVYLQAYWNRLLLLPAVLLSGYWPLYHLGLAGVALGALVPCGYAAGVWVASRRRTGDLAGSYAGAARRQLVYGLLYRLNFLAGAYFIVKSLGQHLLALQPQHPTSRIGAMDAPSLGDCARDLVPALVRTTVLGAVFVTGAVCGYASGVPWVERWCAYYGFANLMLGPFVLRPAFLGALRQRLVRA